MFRLRGELNQRQSIVLAILGFVLLIVLWWILAEFFSVQRPLIEDYNTELPSSLLDENQQINRDSILRADSIAFANASTFEKVYPLLPTPLKVVQSYPSLIHSDRLIPNSLESIWLNLQGYIWAILVSLPFGFLIGLFPVFKGLFSKQVDALRYLPLTALTGLFIVWFGIEDQMKVAFLAFGIIVYLLPVVVQRIWEVDSIYDMTVSTLGASEWQKIKTVYFPAVMSNLMDDIRVLTAISWTYIIIAELVNRAGGIGSLIYIKARQGQIEKVFAILIVIILIGLIQDRIFVFITKRLFPHRAFKSFVPGIREVRYGLYLMIGFLMITVLLTTGFGIDSTLFVLVVAIVMISALLFSLYGEFIIKKNQSN